MAQSKLGGMKTAKTNKLKYGPGFYKRIGHIGGKAGRTGGFYHMKMTGQLDKLKQISSEAGKAGKRGPAIEKAESW